jgi:hypothetical protein
MLSAIVRLLLYRMLGARIMLGLAIFGWIRRLLSGRRASRREVPGSTRTSIYQPSQGSSQIVHREPR